MDEGTIKFLTILLDIKIKNNFIGEVAMWGASCHKWDVKLFYKNKSARFDYHMGIGHNLKPPSCHDVLESLLLGYRVSEMSFDEFLDDYGYHDNLKEGKRIFNGSNKDSKKLVNLLDEIGLKLFTGYYEASDIEFFEELKLLIENNSIEYKNLLKAAIEIDNVLFVNLAYDLGLSLSKINFKKEDILKINSDASKLVFEKELELEKITIKSVTSNPSNYLSSKKKKL